MNGRDNGAEELPQADAMKLLKLWIRAGVPVMVLVGEKNTMPGAFIEKP